MCQRVFSCFVRLLLLLPIIKIIFFVISIMILIRMEARTRRINCLSRTAVRLVHLIIIRIIGGTDERFSIPAHVDNMTKFLILA